MNEGRNERLYAVEVAVGDGDRARVNVLAANEGEAERKAVKAFENQGQKAKAMRVWVKDERTKL